ncbi:MAG: AprI/Inh family metalloprotease inhibitor [Pseudolabrys sp.]|nr:AprI/Inh family metalloprotease inhibitor [Pseudolabrys sp.]
MAGRWLLEAPRAPSCGLNLSESPDGRSGRIVAEGGCPAGFYRGRRWAMDGNTLTIRDDNGDALGQFSQAGERFDGKSATGTTLTLSRPAAPPTE